MIGLNGSLMKMNTEARPISATRLNPFSVFVILYTTAFLLEMMEYWTYPLFTLFFLAISVIFIININRARFSLFLILTTCYFLLFRLPDVANHVNLMIFTNIGIIIGSIVYLFRKRNNGSDEEFYEFIQPILRLMIIVTFFVAGFHKFNLDFINPEVSCIGNFMETIGTALVSDFTGFGIPTIAVASTIAAIAATVLWRRPDGFALPPIDLVALAVPAIATLVGVAALLALVGTSSVTSPAAAVVFVIAVGVLCWQIVESLLLLIPRFQWVALTLSLVVHAQLAMARVVDFQAIALALLATFIPPEVWRAWMRQAQVGFRGFRVHRAYIYLLINMFGGLLMLIHYHVWPFMVQPFIFAGILFNSAVLIMIWPIISDLLWKDRDWRWNGVPVVRAPTSRLLYAVPVALLLFGLTSHFGLRTAGNFSMFSNLRTEGETSNHILFRSNPLKFAGYQEDIVKFIRIDDKAARIGHQYRKLKGNSLPVVEFRKLLLLWREADRVVPLTIEYEGEIMSSDNITTDPRWQVDGWDWEMRLLDFRLIQPGGPNQCRW